jgi:isoleucyl-tRNA synthetase
LTFPKVDEPNVKFVAWTTTPWTLPSNLALCVHPEFDYVKVKDEKTGDFYILAECRLSELYPKKTGFSIVEKFKGVTLRGIKYVPLFTYFEKLFPNAF